MDATSDGHGWILAAVDAHERPLGRYARRLLGDVDLAADAVSSPTTADGELEPPNPACAGRAAAGTPIAVVSEHDEHSERHRERPP